MLFLIICIVAAVSVSAAAASAAGGPEAGHYKGEDSKGHAVSLTVRGNEVFDFKLGNATDDKGPRLIHQGSFHSNFEDIHGNKLRIEGRFPTDSTASGRITENPGTHHVQVATFSAKKQ
jgi:hypothetical protein